MKGTTIGLVADTHVPDRRLLLRTGVLAEFRKAGVSTILHAGDISIPRVLAELEGVAPVIAVRGNRDWFGFDDLPYHRTVTVGEVRIGLTHGHGSWGKYIGDKLRYLLRGPQSFEVALYRAMGIFAQTDVDVVVFGHNHEPMTKHIDGRLVVNPGSACSQALAGKAPTVGLLHIKRRQVRAEIIPLE